MTIIKYGPYYLAWVVDYHHSLGFCGDRMKMSRPKKMFEFFF